MPQDIKIKVRNMVIKEKYTQISSNNRIKESNITTKDNYKDDDKSSNNDISNAQKNAVENVERTGKATTYYSSKKFKEHVIKKHSMKPTNPITSTRGNNESISLSTLKKEANKNYGVNIKTFYLKNQRVNIGKTNADVNKTKYYLNKAYDFVKTTFSYVKNTVSSIGHIISLGVSGIVLVVITLFIGVFASLSDKSVYGASFAPLSDEVLAYTDTITEYATQNGIEEYISLIQAIMMTETKGLGNDPMDAGVFINQTIDNPDYSIEIGVKYIANCLNKANVTSPADTEEIYLAIQGYDFKDEYIIWALNNFDGYSKSNAQIYYDEFLSVGDVNYVNHVMQYIGFGFGTFRLEPNFDNNMAWGYNNPYSRAKLYGQCTWFAWGRFYELYGYSPGFIGDGWNCAKQLVNAHPDKFELSSNPQVGSIYSCIGRNHVGIVVGWDGQNITIQEGNLDGKTNSFAQAKSDWQTVTYDIDTFIDVCKGVVFANITIKN